MRGGEHLNCSLGFLHTSHAKSIVDHEGYPVVVCNLGKFGKIRDDIIRIPDAFDVYCLCIGVYGFLKVLWIRRRDKLYADVVFLQINCGNLGRVVID